MAEACCFCGQGPLETVMEYAEPPEQETRFPLPAGAEYRRRYERCAACGHFHGRHDMDLDALYGGGYVDATYGEDGLLRAYERIMALPPGKSDNVNRVCRVRLFAERHFGAGVPVRVLDVGSGLCVFLGRLRKETGWPCTALDLDPRQAQHAHDAAGVEAICGGIEALTPGLRFDIITLNKVLEHVRDPVLLLRDAAKHVSDRGILYIEVPDAAAANESPLREEFFIEHWHVFTAASLRAMAKRSGLSVLRVDSLREPSGKYTIAAFLAPAASVAAAFESRRDAAFPLYDREDWSAVRFVHSWYLHPELRDALTYRGVNLGEAIEHGLLQQLIEALVARERGGAP